MFLKFLIKIEKNISSVRQSLFLFFVGQEVKEFQDIKIIFFFIF